MQNKGSKRLNQEIRERGLTLFATGRFSSRKEAERVAKERLEAEKLKAEEANKPKEPKLDNFTDPGVFIYTGI